MKMDKEALEIHRDQLEEDCGSLPKILFLAGENLAQAKLEAKQAKNQAKLLEAQISSSIRKNPEEFDLDKVTEKGVESALLLQSDYQEALREQMDAEFLEDLLKAYVEALKEKGEQIGHMTRLHGQQYWSKPDVSSLKEEERIVATKAVQPEMPKRKKGK